MRGLGKTTVSGLLVGFFLNATAVLAEEAPIFDCWIGNFKGKYTMQYIRCIQDRPDTDPSDQEELAQQLLDEIHYEIHWGSSERAEAIVHDNPWLNGGEMVYSIRLFTYPYEWSWEEGNPQYLVRANLCSATMSCRVAIRSD